MPYVGPADESGILIGRAIISRPWIHEGCRAGAPV